MEPDIQLYKVDYGIKTEQEEEPKINVKLEPIHKDTKIKHMKKVYNCHVVMSHFETWNAYRLTTFALDMAHG